jgi:hypothetical protein
VFLIVEVNAACCVGWVVITIPLMSILLKSLFKGRMILSSCSVPTTELSAGMNVETFIMSNVSKILCLGFATASISLLMFPAIVQARDCQLWDVGRGRWTLDQSNGYYIYITFQQHGSILGGAASYHSKSFGNNPTYGGTLNGNIDGNTLTFTTSWGGWYQGWVGGDGAMNGNTHDIQHRESRATWRSDKDNSATCVK